MRHMGGCICYCAPPAILRAQAVWIAQLRVQADDSMREMDYHFLAAPRSGRWYGDGEVQIFADYSARVSEAARARRDILTGLAAPGPEATRSVGPDDTRHTIQQRSLKMKQRRDAERVRKIGRASQ